MPIKLFQTRESTGRYYKQIWTQIWKNQHDTDPFGKQHHLHQEKLLPENYGLGKWHWFRSLLQFNERIRRKRNHEKTCYRPRVWICIWGNKKEKKRERESKECPQILFLHLVKRTSVLNSLYLIMQPLRKKMSSLKTRSRSF